MVSRKTTPQMKERAGFDTLFSTVSIEQDNGPMGEGTDVQWIPLDKIKVKIQPRRYFDEQKLRELADTFIAHGFKGAINVRPRKDGNYDLIAGERRYRAAGMADLQQVRCFVDDYTEEDALRFALAENLLREDLSKLEEIEGILQLIELEHGLSQEKVIKLIQSEGHHRKQTERPEQPSEEFIQLEGVLKYFGINIETFRTKYLKGLKLPDELKQAHLSGKLSFNAALELGKIKDNGVQQQLLGEAVTNGLSFRQVQEKVRDNLQPKSKVTEGQGTAIQSIQEAYSKLKRAKPLKKPTTQQEKKILKIKQLMEELLADLEE
jgi:ParB family transcriptional regulator, chromosome partitioning protein